jgi:hypothetical protein
VPAEPGTKSLKLIAIIEPEKGLACFPVEGEPGAGISRVIGDFDGAHGVARNLRTTHPTPAAFDGSRPNHDQQFMDDIHRLFLGRPAGRVIGVRSKIPQAATSRNGSGTSISLILL